MSGRVEVPPSDRNIEMGSSAEQHEAEQAGSTRVAPGAAAHPTSNDLVSRLRVAGSTGLDLSPGDPLCAEAADEIERLTRELAQVRADWQAICDAADAMPEDPYKAERDRLRALLIRARNWIVSNTGAMPPFDNYEPLCAEILEATDGSPAETGDRTRYADSVGIAAEAFKRHKERPRNMVGDEHWVNGYARAVQDFRTGNVPDVRRATETGGERS